MPDRRETMTENHFKKFVESRCCLLSEDDKKSFLETVQTTIDAGISFEDIKELIELY